MTTDLLELLERAGMSLIHIFALICEVYDFASLSCCWSFIAEYVGGCDEGIEDFLLQ